jgi:hypothetical protein
MDKPVLSKQAFWDVDMDKIDYHRDAALVVEKVIERGKASDFDNIIKFYGFKRLGELALQANWLSDVSINFCCVLFKVKPTDFKCYTESRLNSRPLLPKLKNNKPKISDSLFGDVNMEKLDFREHAVDVVERVIERGTTGDFDELIKFYGFGMVGKLALQAKWLSPENIDRCCVLFSAKPTDFNCYAKTQLIREHLCS